MGKKSRARKSWMCGACKAGFGSELAVRQHISDAHSKVGAVGIYQRVGEHRGRDFDDEPSFAERAIEASIAVAAGEYTDDGWLLP